MRSTKMTPAQTQQDLSVSSPATQLAVTTRGPSGIVLAPAPAHHDTSIARANPSTPVDPQVEDQQYEPQAIMFAGWCLQSAPQWQRDVDYSTWSPEYQRLCAKLNTRPLAGWEAYSFEMINGYNPRDLKGADAYLFRIYMRVWQERFGSPRSTAQRRPVVTAMEPSTPPHQVGDISNREELTSAQQSMCRLFESWLRESASEEL